MSAGEAPDDARIDPALRQALDLNPPVHARADFREQLRQTFLAAPFEARDAAPVEEQDLGPAPIVAPRWDEAVLAKRRLEAGAPSKPVWIKLVTLAAIAAAVWLLLQLPTKGGWRVAESSSFESARVDGVEFTRQQSGRLAAAIVPGCLLEVEGGAIDLVLDRRMVLRLSPGGALRMLGVPKPNVLEDILLEQQRGSLAVVTWPEFQGATLRVRTPQTEVRVVGTEFALDLIEDEGTCVCCGEGSVEIVEPAAGAYGLVPGGRMSLVSSRNQPTLNGPVIESHLLPLETLRRIRQDLR